MTDMTALSSPSARVEADPIDISLRLWSDTVALEPLLAHEGLRPSIVHIRGAPIPRGGRIARRNFASVAIGRVREWADVGSRIKGLTAQIAQNDDLKKLVIAGTIEMVFWIAIFSDAPGETLEFQPQTVDDVARLGAAIFIEDYAHPLNGIPAKRWLPAEPGKGSLRPDQQGII